MKKLVLLVIAIMIAGVSIAQPWTVSSPTFSNPNYYPSPYVQVGQMVNTAKTYSYLSSTWTKNSFNDTAVTGTSTFYLYTAKLSGSSFVPYGIYGNGSISFLVSGIKISGTPAGNITVEQSTDGTANSFAPVNTSRVRVAFGTLSTPDTFIITNIATQQSYSYDYASANCPFYRLNISTTGTETSSWKGWYIFKANVGY